MPCFIGLNNKRRYGCFYSTVIMQLKCLSYLHFTHFYYNFTSHGLVILLQCRSLVSTRHLPDSGSGISTMPLLSIPRVCCISISWRLGGDWRSSGYYQNIIFTPLPHTKWNSPKLSRFRLFSHPHRTGCLKLFTRRGFLLLARAETTHFSLYLWLRFWYSGEQLLEAHITLFQTYILDMSSRIDYTWHGGSVCALFSKILPLAAFVDAFTGSASGERFITYLAMS